MATYAQNSEKTAQAIRDRRQFRTTGNLAGVDGNMTHGRGRIHDHFLGTVNTYKFLGYDIDFTLYSYATPIAVHVADGVEGFWLIDVVSHSASSNTALRMVRSALSSVNSLRVDEIGHEFNTWNYALTPQQRRALEHVWYGGDAPTHPKTLNSLIRMGYLDDHGLLTDSAKALLSVVVS